MIILRNSFMLFTQNILNIDRSIRQVGITDKNGIIINERDRPRLKPLLTLEENYEFAINTIKRHKTRLKFDPKMGELTYTFRRDTRMSRCLIPIKIHFWSNIQIKNFFLYNIIGMQKKTNTYIYL